MMTTAPSSVIVVNKCVNELSNAPSTSKGLAVSIRLYNDFALKNHFPQYNELTQDYLKEEVQGGDGVTNLHTLLRKFAAFVLLPLKRARMDVQPTIDLTLLHSILVILSQVFLKNLLVY